MAINAAQFFMKTLGITPQKIGETLAGAGLGDANEIASQIERGDPALAKRLKPVADGIMKEHPALAATARGYLETNNKNRI